MASEKKRSTVSRRDLIKGAAVGAAAVAGASALGGCGGAAPASASNVPSKWDQEFDVVVVGSGAAGFAAAITAADAGASVVLLEKLPYVGGNSALSGGNYGAPGTDLQLKQGETDEAFRDDSVDLYYNEKRKLGCYRSDPKLTRIFAEQALDGYKWLQSMGIVWNVVGTYETPIYMPKTPQAMHLSSLYNVDFTTGKWIGTMTKGRHHKGSVYKEFESGQANIAAMHDTAKAKGVNIMTEMAMTEIIREQPLAGDVLGVRVDDLKNGKEVTIRAKKGVVMAAGGFSANGEWCARLDSRLNPKGPNTGVPGVTGEALIAAIDIGADTMNMDFVQIRMARNGISYGSPLLLNKTGTYIDIDPDGKRFWKEMGDIVAFRYARLTELYERGFDRWWSISDSDALEANKVKPEALEESLKEGSTVKAETLEELAEIVKAPVDTLAATLKRYNEMVEKGVDDDFGQDVEYLTHKIEKAPFYAVPRTVYRQHTCGGVRITEKAEIVDRRGKVIPRIYAAGEFLGGVHGVERNGGCGWTECIVFGRIAGAQVAALEPRA